jgi:hypothetical protein
MVAQLLQAMDDCVEQWNNDCVVQWNNDYVEQWNTVLDSWIERLM